MFTFMVTLNFIIETASKFVINGKAFNRGEFLEMAYKSFLGFDAEKDSNTSYRDGDDIPQTCESVKSKGFSLTCADIGTTKQEIIDAFMETVHSKKFTYLSFDGNNIVTGYSMDKQTFKKFLELFGSMDYESRSKKPKIRVKHESKKMVEWLTKNASA